MIPILLHRAVIFPNLGIEGRRSNGKKKKEERKITPISWQGIIYLQREGKREREAVNLFLERSFTVG